MVAIPTVAAQAPDPTYNVENFQYHPQEDHYLCPQGSKLTTTGKWHQAKTYQFKRYTTKDCKRCTVKDFCTKAKYGKGIQRSEYQELTNQNKARIKNNKAYYRKRQAIVEHPYGTIKRQWGFSYILKQYKERASADVGFIFTAYNLRRLFNILDKNMLKEYLKTLNVYFLIGIEGIQNKISSYITLIYATKFIISFNLKPTKQLRID